MKEDIKIKITSVNINTSKKYISKFFNKTHIMGDSLRGQEAEE